VIAEGSGILVMETLESAKSRNAPILAEIVGYGASADGHHITTPTPNGHGASLAMKCALSQAGIFPDDIDYINAHATSTPIGDQAESNAIESVFYSSTTQRYKDTASKGNSKPLYVSSTKGATGHMLGAAGAVEAIFAIYSLYQNAIPPTLNLENVENEEKLKFSHVKKSVLYPSTEMNYVMSNSFGFGGTNASLVFKKYTDSKP
jgi:3-oxoacyl-[acyl-carrier-protein] synthase II